MVLGALGSTGQSKPEVCQGGLLDNLDSAAHCACWGLGIGVTSEGTGSPLLSELLENGAQQLGSPSPESRAASGLWVSH